MRKTGEILRPMIRLPNSPDECWEWIGKVGKTTGYGYKQLGGKTELAHRWVYQLFNGWIPEEMVINHLCSNRKCVNPRHLEATTQAGNCRHGKGSKLTAEQAAAIKDLLKTAKWGDRKKIADQFGVSVCLISDIKYGRAWRE